MQFTKMKITGFKSFVEPTEFLIEQGLTGIVGPNGCGKSNIVESLRWAMGENSARRLRGGDMDDVIFSGSAGRPSRNIAEVALYLDNSQRTALAEFNNEDEVEVIRHIERGMGSDYRINGRPVRQKDVQLLFADQATGAHSTSIVSQGRISALIQAKPQDRRQVLEEAAGISGLHARRHEAELKLKGAEGNLTRVDDQLQAMDAQLRGLKTQVRQASRYRNLGELLRKAEAGLLFLRAKQAEVNLRIAEDTHAEAEGLVRELTSAVTVLTTERTDSATALPPLRQAEAAASAIVQRLHLESEALAREAARLAGQQEALRARAAQAAQDEAREQALLRDAEAAQARLDEEAKGIVARQEAEETARPQIEADVAAIRERIAAEEKTTQELTEQLAQTEARARALSQQMDAVAARQQQLTRRQDEARSAIAALEAEMANLPSLALAQSLIDASETDVTRKQAQAHDARTARSEAEAELAKARSVREEAALEKAKMDAENAALEKILQLENTHGTPLSDLVKVEPGYEAAFAAALGDALSAPLDAAAKIFWQELPPMGDSPALPSGAAPLSSYVEAPAALSRALRHIGLVENEQAGERAAAQLAPGQVLVSREGGAWRWDGYTQREGAVTPAATRLQQRNRLAELQALVQYASTRAAEAETQLAEAQRVAMEAAATDNNASAALQLAFAALNDARRHYADEAQAQAHKGAQLQRQKESEAQLASEIETVTQEAAALQAQKNDIGDIRALSDQLSAMRLTLAESRREGSETEARRATFAREMDALAQRANAIKQEYASWTTRADNARTHANELAARQEALRVEEAELAEKPAQLEAQKQQLLSQGAEAEEKRRIAADALMQAETQLAQIEKRLRAQEEALSNAKESRVRSEEQMYQAQHAFEACREKAEADWHTSIDGLLEKAEAANAGELPSMEQLEHDFARFTRERENMGPVNLRAEMEAEELQAQIDKMTAEKDDLVQAIAKLRQGIGTLNREARERLQKAFDEVSAHFGQLFTRMFGGGKAHLELIENEDPLEAGLEIFASPPGKRLQALSLLSGGEQALTALSLLFALFLVNPSPICVLDEVDAPLDEANVDRYCMLLREMADSGKTRFLVVTHHRLTMARMDRLYGVTMAEKGVSQLISVDLRQALALREQGSVGAPANDSAISEAAE